MYKFIFGPIKSNRIGSSLGIDVLGKKICNFNCVYCEIKKTEKLTMERAPYVSRQTIRNELKQFFSEYPDIALNYITFSGKGEPTLNSEIGKMILDIKKNYSFPICVITNGSLLFDPQVRQEISEADLIMPSLDAVSIKNFIKSDLPHPDITPEKIIQGIIDLKKEFKGQIWMEILLMQNINDSESEISLLKQAMQRIQPDKICLNTVFRPPSFSHAKPISTKRLQQLQKEFDELLPNSPQCFPSSKQSKNSGKNPLQRKTLLEILNVRPSSLKATHEVLLETHKINISQERLEKELNSLIAEGKIKIKSLPGMGGEIQYKTIE